MDIDALFAAWQAGIDSVPFAHESTWINPVGDLRTEDTP